MRHKREAASTGGTGSHVIPEALGVVNDTGNNGPAIQPTANVRAICSGRTPKIQIHGPPRPADVAAQDTAVRSFRLARNPSAEGSAWKYSPRRIHIIISRVLRTVTAGRHRTTVRPLEEPAIPVVLLDAEAAFVHQPVVPRAEQHQVPETRLATGRPVFDMVDIDEARMPAAGKLTTLVARPQSAFDRGWNDPGFAPDAQRFAVLVLDDDKAVAVAGEPPHGLDRQPGPAFALRECHMIDVHGDLVTVRNASRCAVIAVEIGLRNGATGRIAPNAQGTAGMGA